MPTVACFGVCSDYGKRVPVKGWKDPDTGLHCTVCQGSGVFTAKNAMEEAAADWDRVRPKTEETNQRKG